MNSIGIDTCVVLRMLVGEPAAEQAEAASTYVDRLIRMDFLDDAPEIRTFDRDFAKLDNVSPIGG